MMRDLIDRFIMSCFWYVIIHIYLDVIRVIFMFAMVFAIPAVRDQAAMAIASTSAWLAVSGCTIPSLLPWHLEAR